jgi:uncharacterized protein (DUF302 family)
MPRFHFVPALLFMLMLGAPALAADNNPIVRYSAKAKFEHARDDLVNAITGRGLVIDHNSHVASMLDRTGKDLGTTKKIYGSDQGQVFSFCSAVVSRQTMEADPGNIVFCPYSIAIYTTLAEPDKVTIAYRRPQLPGASAASKTALEAVEKLLDGIVREALNLP